MRRFFKGFSVALFVSMMAAAPALAQKDVNFVLD